MSESQERRIEELRTLVAHLEDDVRMTNLRNDTLSADMERLEPWIALLTHAPAAHRQSIQERYLAAEVIGQIVQAWKDRVVQQEKRIRELEAQVACLRNQ